jgi:hypothetical protein
MTNQIFAGNTGNPLPQTDFLEQQPINRPTRAWIQFFLNMMNNTSSTTATAGSATLPDNPAGFMNVTIEGKPYKVPYYLP